MNSSQPNFDAAERCRLDAVLELWCHSPPCVGLEHWRPPEGALRCWPGVQVRTTRDEMKRLKKELLRAKEEVQRALAVEAECVSPSPFHPRRTACPKLPLFILEPLLDPCRLLGDFRRSLGGQLRPGSPSVADLTPGAGA